MLTTRGVRETCVGIDVGNLVFGEKGSKEGAHSVVHWKKSGVNSDKAQHHLNGNRETVLLAAQVWGCVCLQVVQALGRDGTGGDHVMHVQHLVWHAAGGCGPMERWRC
mmetsp:Transcript_22453/g.67574  ORF Transcript_22453/g.67574 Transcript_22453/m.67574 type:complete len:108 (+) Transcript_22453:244-567(+)